MSPDLMARLIEVGELRLERVIVETVREFTFYATIVVARLAHRTRWTRDRATRSTWPSGWVRRSS